MSPIIIVIVSFIYCLDHLVENRDEFVKINKTVSVDVRGEEHHVDLLLRQIDATRLEQLMHTSAYLMKTLESRTRARASERASERATNSRNACVLLDEGHFVN